MLLAFDLSFEQAPLLQKVLRRLLVVPEVGRGSLRLDLV